MDQLGDIKEAQRLKWLCEQWRMKAARIELTFGKHDQRATAVAVAISAIETCAEELEQEIRELFPDVMPPPKPVKVKS